MKFVQLGQEHIDLVKSRSLQNKELRGLEDISKDRSVSFAI
jgi:hypothetical protein